MLIKPVLLLTLTTTVLSHAHHDDHEVAPQHVREGLLKKWDQEVFNLIILLPRERRQF